jgi:hypothetical protein
MNIESQQKLSKLPTEELESESFKYRHDGEFVVGLVVASEIETREPTHAIIIGSSEQANPWKAWYKLESLLGEEHRGYEKIKMNVGQELLIAS